MRIALLPTITISNLTSDSGFWWGAVYAQEFAKLGVETVLLLPDVADKFDLLEHLPEQCEVRTIGKHLGTPAGVHPNVSAIFEMVHPREGDCLVDVLLTSNMATGAAIQMMQSDCSPEDRILIWLNDSMILSPKSRTMRGLFSGTQLGGEIDESMAHLLGYVYPMVDRLIFDTKLAEKAALELCRHGLAATAIKKVMKRGRRYHLGFDLTNAQAAVDSAGPKYEQFTLFFGGRMNALKRPELVLKAFVHEFGAGHECKIVMTSPKDDGAFWQKVSPTVRKLVEFKPNLSSKEFIAEATRSHVVLYPSAGEGLSFGVIQLLLTGTVVLLPRLAWAEEIVGEDYPWLFDQNADIDGWLRHIRENYDACVQEALKWQAYAMERFSDCSGYGELLAQAKADVHALMRRRLTDKNQTTLLIQEAYQELPDVFGFEQALDKVCELSQALVKDRFGRYGTVRRRYPSRLGVLRVFREVCGARVSGTSVEGLTLSKWSEE